MVNVTLNSENVEVLIKAIFNQWRVEEGGRFETQEELDKECNLFLEVFNACKDCLEQPMNLDKLIDYFVYNKEIHCKDELTDSEIEELESNCLYSNDEVIVMSF